MATARHDTTFTHHCCRVPGCCAPCTVRLWPRRGHRGDHHARGVGARCRTDAATATHPDRARGRARFERGLAEAGASLLLEVVIACTWCGRRNATDDAHATLRSQAAETESPIDWSLAAHTIHNRVRGLQPWPMASTAIDGSAKRHSSHSRQRRSHGRAAPAPLSKHGGDVIAVAAGAAWCCGSSRFSPKDGAP